MNQVNAALAAGTWTGIPYLYSWGRNAIGQLGLGNITYYSSPKQVGTLTTWSDITAGGQSTAVIKTDGTLWAWGYNGFGQLGLGNTVDKSSPSQVGALTTWYSISSGSQFMAAIKTDGTLWSWGRNATYGSLGLGDTVNRSSPVQVGALTTWYKVAAGYRFTIAVKTDGTLWSWGLNSQGQLGYGGYSISRSSPVQVGALTTWLTLPKMPLSSSSLAIKG